MAGSRMITLASEWVVKLLYREWNLGDLSILHCILDGVNMPQEGTMNQGYEFCRNRWVLKWQELARQPMNAEAKLKAVSDYADAASAWNSDSQLAGVKRKHHAPKCPAGTNA